MEGVQKIQRKLKVTIERVAGVTNKIQIAPKRTMSGNLHRGTHSEVTNSPGSSASEANSRGMTNQRREK